ncbi:inorganic phosphate transporter [Methylobacterium sp. WSM2598]|uniref:inorganic phosphate transporter n=1 Tax=Methylobacterium sp. WSM2598 TaxID=398261 RepID=UPI00037AACD4
MSRSAVGGLGPVAGPSGTPQPKEGRPNLDGRTSVLAAAIFVAVLGGALLCAACGMRIDVIETGTAVVTSPPVILPFVALTIALAFEFVTGFHDTANAVATVICSHSLPATVAVVWSGLFNFLGVLPVSTTHVLSSGAAGTMAANRSGLQPGTLRNLAMAWLLTLPVAMLLSGLLYAVSSQVF